MNSMRHFVTFVSLIACATVVEHGNRSWAQDAPKVPTSKEFSEKYDDSETDRSLVVKAIENANILLGPDSPFVLQPSWAPAPAEGKTIIPVFLGKPRGAESHSIAFVPDGESCIIIEAGELAILDSMMGNTAKNAVKQPLPTCLTVVLLHETGHIAQKHNGRMDGKPDKYVVTKKLKEEADLDIETRIEDAKLAMTKANFKSEEKQREFDADAFAANRFSNARDDKARFSRSMRALNLVTSIPMICWNLGTARMLDAFKAENLLKLDRNTVYWDSDNEHPNFELRMLTINALIARGTEAEKGTQELVLDFTARQGMIENGLILPRVKPPE